MKHNSVIENRFLIYELDDNIKIEIILEEENVWLTQEQISKSEKKSKFSSQWFFDIITI